MITGTDHQAKAQKAAERRHVIRMLLTQLATELEDVPENGTCLRLTLSPTDARQYAEAAQAAVKLI